MTEREVLAALLAIVAVPAIACSAEPDSAVVPSEIAATPPAASTADIPPAPDDIPFELVSLRKWYFGVAGGLGTMGYFDGAAGMIEVISDSVAFGLMYIAAGGTGERGDLGGEERMNFTGGALTLRVFQPPHRLGPWNGIGLMAGRPGLWLRDSEGDEAEEEADATFLLLGTGWHGSKVAGRGIYVDVGAYFALGIGNEDIFVETSGGAISSNAMIETQLAGFAYVSVGVLF